MKDILKRIIITMFILAALMIAGYKYTEYIFKDVIAKNEESQVEDFSPRYTSQNIGDSVKNNIYIRNNFNVHVDKTCKIKRSDDSYFKYDEWNYIGIPYNGNNKFMQTLRFSDNQDNKVVDSSIYMSAELSEANIVINCITGILESYCPDKIVSSIISFWESEKIRDTYNYVIDQRDVKVDVCKYSKSDSLSLLVGIQFSEENRASKINTFYFKPLKSDLINSSTYVKLIELLNARSVTVNSVDITNNKDIEFNVDAEFISGEHSDVIINMENLQLSSMEFDTCCILSTDDVGKFIGNTLNTFNVPNIAVDIQQVKYNKELSKHNFESSRFIEEYNVDGNSYIFDIVMTPNGEFKISFNYTFDGR